MVHRIRKAPTESACATEGTGCDGGSNISWAERRAIAENGAERTSRPGANKASDAGEFECRGQGLGPGNVFLVPKRSLVDDARGALEVSGVFS